MSTYTNTNGVTFDYTSTPSITSSGSITISGGDYSASGTVYVVPYSLLTTYVTTTSGTVTIASLLTNATYFDVPSVTATYNITVALAGSTTFHIGGTGTVNVGVSALSGVVVDVDGGAATFTDTAGAATTFTGNLNSHGSLTIGTGLIGLLSGSTINYGTEGGTLVLSNGTSGSIIDLSGFTINGFNTGGAGYIVDKSISYASISTGSYTVANSGADQVINFYSAAGATGTNEGSLTLSGNSLAVGTFATASTTGALTVSSSDGFVDITPTCFLRGSMIATPIGEVFVETLRVGDLVTTVTKGKRDCAPVIWLGHRTLHVAQYNNHIDMFPVRIRANAVGESLPVRDLLVTSEHSLFIDGKLIPARMLVNGSSIIVDTSITEFEYFHVELEQHAIIIADGLETESYLDTGNRCNFVNYEVASMMVDFTVNANHKSWETHSVAPLCTDRDSVEKVWNQLSARAASLGFAGVAQGAMDSEPELRLLTAGGMVIRPTIVDGDVFTFDVPADAGKLRLLSRTFRPSEAIGPFVDDRRTLGVFVGRIGLTVDDQHSHVVAHLADADLAGWHPTEGTGRWTNGDALLPIALSPTQGPGSLEIEIVTIGLYHSTPVAALLAA